VFLIQAFAGVGVFAYVYFIATTQTQFQKPVGVCKALPGGTDDIGNAIGKRRLGLGKAVDATGNDHRCFKTGLTDSGTDDFSRLKVAAERTLLI